jgi:NitT/TauT family transport system substrate-binding protein/putative hydroxymethylpyrimidine transport system substrate-binding protein
VDWGIGPRLLVAVAVLSALVAVGCGDDDGNPDASKPRQVTLALDFTPNAVQAPVFSAVRAGYDKRHGIRLRVREPGQGPDGAKLVVNGRAQLALLDIHDLAIVREQGTQDIVAIGALVGRPLAALLAQPAIRRPRDLEHRTVGVSGLPSDPAFLRAIMQADGADPDTVRQVTIGFSAVQRLATGRVAAVPAFWNAEGIALRERGRPVSVFKVEDYGAPPYPEVLIITSRKTLAARRDDLRAALSALADGLQATLAHPERAADWVADAAAADDPAARALVRAQLRAVAPTYAPALRLDHRLLERWATWETKVGIVKRRPDIARAFVFDLHAR